MADPVLPVPGVIVPGGYSPNTPAGVVPPVTPIPPVTPASAVPESAPAATAGMSGTNPYFSLLQNVDDVKTKVADSIFESYKLQVAQAADINNRAMQVALNNAQSIADLKAAVNKSTLETMLAAARTEAAIAATAMQTQRVIMEEAERTRALINSLNTQNLNTALINTNVSLSGLAGQYAGLGLAAGQIPVPGAIV
jgi:hypothetical protein